MNPIKVIIHGTGEGACALTGKDSNGLIVTFEDGTVSQAFLSWASFKQLLALKTKQYEKAKAPPAGNGNAMPTAMK